MIMENKNEKDVIGSIMLISLFPETDRVTMRRQDYLLFTFTLASLGLLGFSTYLHAHYKCVDRQIYSSYCFNTSAVSIVYTSSGIDGYLSFTCNGDEDKKINWSYEKTFSCDSFRGLVDCRDDNVRYYSNSNGWVAGSYDRNERPSRDPKDSNYTFCIVSIFLLVFTSISSVMLLFFSIRLICDLVDRKRSVQLLPHHVAEIEGRDVN